MLQKAKKIGQGCLMILGVLFIVFIISVIFQYNNDPPATVATVPTFTPTPQKQVILPTVTPVPPTATDMPPQTLTPTPVPSDDEIKATAGELPEYKELFRHIENYIGQFVHFRGKIIQSTEYDNRRVFRVQLDDGNVIWTEYFGEDRFLEDDYVEVWGTVRGIETYTTLLLSEIEIPRVSIKFISLLSD